MRLIFNHYVNYIPMYIFLKKDTSFIKNIDHVLPA